MSYRSSVVYVTHALLLITFYEYIVLAFSFNIIDRESMNGIGIIWAVSLKSK